MGNHKKTNLTKRYGNPTDTALFPGFYIAHRAGLDISLKDQRTNVSRTFEVLIKCCHDNDNVYMRLLLFFCNHYREQ